MKEICYNLADATTVISVISSVLLCISEILPYIKAQDGNGIIHVITKMITNKQAVNESSNENV